MTSLGRRVALALWRRRAGARLRGAFDRAARDLTDADRAERRALTKVALERWAASPHLARGGTVSVARERARRAALARWRRREWRRLDRAIAPSVSRSPAARMTEAELVAAAEAGKQATRRLRRELEPRELAP